MLNTHIANRSFEELTCEYAIGILDAAVNVEQGVLSNILCQLIFARELQLLHHFCAGENFVLMSALWTPRANNQRTDSIKDRTLGIFIIRV